MVMTSEGIKNGRALRGDDPLLARLRANVADYRERGEQYPRRTVDDLYAHPFAWWGSRAYHTETLELLVASHRAKAIPTPLPDGYVIDGERRLPRENVKNYNAYLAYRDMGPDRTLKEFRKKFPERPAISYLASRMRWEERCAAYDSKMQVEAERVSQQVMQDQIKEELARRHEYLTNEWNIVERGIEIVNEMMKYPVVEKRSEKVSRDGKTIVTIWQPGKWTYASMAQMMEALAKIGRLNTGLSTANTAVKSELLMDGSQKREIPSGDNEEMHVYASQVAEEAYFNACEEWKRNHLTPERISAHVQEVA